MENASIRRMPSAALALGLLIVAAGAASAQEATDVRHGIEPVRQALARETAETGDRAGPARRTSARPPAEGTESGRRARQDAERRRVLDVLHGLFDAMRAKDSSAVRALFHEEGRLIATGAGAGGGPGIRVIPADAFAASIGRATGHLDERFWNPEVRIDQDLATVWTEYAFYLDGELSHCGVDAFIMVRQEGEWRIATVADTRRPEGCEIPEEARPGE